MTFFAEKYRGKYTKEIDSLVDKMNKYDKKIKEVSTKIDNENKPNKELLEEYYTLTTTKTNIWEEIQKKANETTED